MKLQGKDIALIAIAVVVIVVIVAFGFPSAAGGDDVTSTVTIDFMDTPAPRMPGNDTTWEKVGGSWQYTSVVNGTGGSSWTFKNVTSGPNCYLQLMEAARIGEFSVITENLTLGLLVYSIDGLQNQESGGPGWQFYVNGLYANRACNMISIANSDHVVWQYRPLVT